MSRTEERARLIATFMLYGYAPASKIGKRGHPIRATVLCNAQGVIIGVEPGKPAYRNANRKVCAKVDRRVPRSWDDLTLGQLRRMHARLMIGDGPLPKVQEVAHAL